MSALRADRGPAMAAPAPSREVAWHEARAEAHATARALGTAIIAASLVLGLSASWCAYGWTFAAGYALLWAGCIAIVRRLP